MNQEETLKHVKRLLGLLKGVAIDWEESSSKMLRLGLSINNQRSLAILAHIGVVTNIPLVVEVAWECNRWGHDSPDCVRYDLRIPIKDTQSGLTTKLQEVGGYLAIKLKNDGVLDSSDAAELFNAWNFGVENCNKNNKRSL